ncbi:MAG TPA: YbaK/EbsC family protein [Gemmataceae bacterium]
MRLDEFLSSRHVPFTRLSHPPAYTANRVAQALHVPGKEMAKTVLLRTGHGYVLAVLPATHRVDLDQLRQELGEEEVWLATEEEMDKLFPDCERGAMPPFGSMYHLPTLMDEALAADEEIVFEGQNHEEAIRMTCRDYLAVEHPRVGHFAYR